VTARAGLLVALLALASAGCSQSAPDPHADVLLFNGTGTSPNDVRALEDILRERHIAYAKADSAALDALSLEQLRAHHLLIIPGGNFEQMGNHLQPATSTRIREAVHGGLNYLGVCAGAFMAGNSPYNGINLTGGVRFGFYSAAARGIRKAAVPISTPYGNLEHYWEDGPQLSGWGEAVANYPDGTPAVAQGHAGKGWVILVGTHPEAPQNWREGLGFTTPASESRDYAARLVEAALTGKAAAAPY
jgi:glutamine amidotransferase-like uncharacterized protein